LCEQQLSIIHKLLQKIRLNISSEIKIQVVVELKEVARKVSVKGDRSTTA